MGYVRIAMNNARPTLLLGNFVMRNAKMSSKASTPSHYETLKVNHRATQAEIKSAYFKLSKQYHPDKNSSAEATAKFRDVAEAYEVLGNYSSRKTYDRSILTRTQYHGAQPGDNKSTDPKIKYYQSQAAVFRDSKKSGSTPMYDFDAWTKAHYGKTFYRAQADKAQSAKRRVSRKENYSPPNTTRESAFVCFVLMVTATMWILSIQKPHFDDPTLSIQHSNEILENGSTNMESQRTDV